MTLEAVLDLVDNAPAFVDVDPATLAQAERKFGLEQLNAGLAQIRAAEGADRLPAAPIDCRRCRQSPSSSARSRPPARSTRDSSRHLSRTLPTALA
ncbi:hypothetical protein [Bradyrhizobium sp. SEMIA]|uniref:hypothetical protein n=1 Tax=Bradyrhizobium sp. SEMIA TaxID=2597515 RepID=UPI0018A5A1E0|nr:hypothetical protein [Bradyrhizobium sp. SEMIA]QOG20440.1 hypothetical protein FOM02_26905 [Bradyrhizobium sp. SEMIA]